MADDFEEASLDDFFQPPAEEAPAAPPPAVARRAPTPKTATADEMFAGSAPEAAAASQVEELPITDLGTSRFDKKKILIIGGAVAGVLVLLIAGYFLLSGGESAPPTAQSIAATTPPALPATPAPTPKLELSRLTDLDRVPEPAHAAASTLFDPAAGAFSAAGRDRVAKFSPPLSFYVGTFVVSERLNEAKEKLRGAGLTPRVKEGRAQVPMHRLHVASHETRAAAERDKAKLARVGFKAFVIKENRTSYQVYAGSFFTKEKAKEFQTRLFQSGSGFVGELTATRVEMPVWELWAGSFPTPDAVQPALAALVGKNIEFDVVASR